MFKLNVWYLKSVEMFWFFFNSFFCKHWLRLKTIASTRPKDSHAVKDWAFSFHFYSVVLPDGFTCCRRVIMLQLNYSCYQRHLSRSHCATCRFQCVKLCVSSCFSLGTLHRQAGNVSSRLLSSVCCCRLATDFYAATNQSSIEGQRQPLVAARA